MQGSDVNCTRIIPFRENLVQSHRFKSFCCGTHTTVARIHCERCEKCTCGREAPFLRLLRLLFLFLFSVPTWITAKRAQRYIAIAQWTLHPGSSRTFSFTSVQVFRRCSIAGRIKCVCVCGCVSGRRERRRRWCQMRQWYLHSNTIIIMWLGWRCHCLFMFHPRLGVCVCGMGMWGVCAVCSENYLVKAKIDGWLRWFSAFDSKPNIFFYFLCVGCVYRIHEISSGIYGRMNMCQTCISSVDAMPKSIYLLRLTGIGLAAIRRNENWVHSDKTWESNATGSTPVDRWWEVN